MKITPRKLIKYFITFLITKYFHLLLVSSCYLMGIEIGKYCRFYGKMKFCRFPHSLIRISDHCGFRSSYASNLIGINHPCIIATHRENAEIIIGKGCGFSGTVIGAFSSIKLGNNVRCGANTTITDADWHLDDPRSGKPAPIVIEDNVWLGLNAIVLKGVIIGRNSVIGAGSVVTKNIPPNVIAAGNPCKVIKSLE